MSDRFTNLVKAYADQLLPLTARIYRCAPTALLLGVPTFLANQVSFVLSFLLPLKVIIMLGSEGVPRYFSSFMTDESRSAWMIALAAGSIGFFVLYFVSSRILVGLGERAGARIVRSSGKTGLFNDQERFAADLFGRVVDTWGTVAMAAGGILLGLLLEWRLVVLLIVAIGLEFVVFSIYWNRFSEPERAGERERLAERRAEVLQNLSGFNVLVLFVGLVVLLLTDSAMNFIVAVVLFLLTRQILSRSVRVSADAHFFMRNRERIDALVHPERHLHEQRTSGRESFEHLLMPAQRERLFRAVANTATEDLSGRSWEWRDVSGRDTALFASVATDDDEAEYRLKVTMRSGDAGLARERMFYRSASSATLDLCCGLVDAGTVFDRGFLLLKSTRLVPCPRSRFQDLAFRIRMRFWDHHPDDDLSSRLLRSFPPLEARLTPDRMGRIRLACNTRSDERLVDRFAAAHRRIDSILRGLPKVLTHHGLAPANLLLTAADRPVLLNWDALRFDVIGSDLLPQEFRRSYTPDRIEASSEPTPAAMERLPEQALLLVVRLAQVDRLILRGNYAEALASLPRILEAVDAYPDAAGDRPG